MRRAALRIRKLITFDKDYWMRDLLVVISLELVGRIELTDQGLGHPPHAIDAADWALLVHKLSSPFNLNKI